MSLVRTSALIAAPIDLVFDLARDVRVHTRGLAHTLERAVPPGVTDGPLDAGDVVCLRAWHLGLPWRYDARVVVCDPPTRLVDVQERGPWRSMRHEHRLVETGAGTLLLDELSWDSRFGPLGATVDALLLRRYLRRLLLVRDAHLRQVAEQEAEARQHASRPGPPYPAPCPQPAGPVHNHPEPASPPRVPTEEWKSGAPTARGRCAMPGLGDSGVRGPTVGGPTGGTIPAGRAVDLRAVDPSAVDGTAVAGLAARGPGVDRPAVEGAAVDRPAVGGTAGSGRASVPTAGGMGTAPLVVVAVALVAGDGRVLAAERRDGGWEFPGGKVEPGESDESALIRECDEELGVGIALTGRLGGEQPIPPGDHQPIPGGERPAPGAGGAVLRLWTGRITRGEPSPRVHAGLRWLRADELPDVDWLPADRPFLPLLATQLGPRHETR